jgi:hypothetical protein
VRSEEPHRGEVDASFGEQVENQGEPARGAGDLDAVVGLVLAESERGPAVAEERFEALADVKRAGLDLGEVRDEGMPFLPSRH